MYISIYLSIYIFYLSIYLSINLSINLSLSIYIYNYNYDSSIYFAEGIDVKMSSNLLDIVFVLLKAVYMFISA